MQLPSAISLTGRSGGESRQSSVLNLFTENLADPVQLRDSESWCTKNDQCSHADVGSKGPSALSALVPVIRSVSAQQVLASCLSM